VGDIRNSYKIFVGKPEGRRPLGKHRCMWEDNIRMDLREIESKAVGLNASALGYGPVVGSCEHVNEPAGSIKGG
jgi:hypothetical protein